MMDPTACMLMPPGAVVQGEIMTGAPALFVIADGAASPLVDRARLIGVKIITSKV